MAQSRSEAKAAAEKKARLQALSKGPDLERFLEGRKRKFVTYAQEPESIRLITIPL